MLYTQEIPALRSAVETLYKGRWCRFGSPKDELGKVAFSSMFLKRKKSQRFGASSFSKCHYTGQKYPFATPGPWTVLNEQKNHFAIVRNSERRSYRTDLSRFVLPISDTSPLNFSQFVGFQDSPNLSKIEKVAETCEFDGKEPLFVERDIAISNRVLGWILTETLSMISNNRLYFE